ncbi:MAG: hypothetical protein ACRDTA_17670 [Pseudonocardiaceae bacterium]
MISCGRRGNASPPRTTPTRACGTTALDQAQTLRSHRTLDQLRELNRHAAPHQRIGEVAHLRHRINTLALAS